MRASWDQRRVAAAAVGGALGASLRWAVLTATPASLFPWPVFLVNVAGSLVLGALMAEEWKHPTARLLLHDGGGIGFCGGLTTFSTFSVEVVDLAKDGHTDIAVLYALTSVGGAILALVAGAALLGRVRAPTLPLEEAP